MKSVTRRTVLTAAIGAAAASIVPARGLASPIRLVAAPGEAGLVVPDGPATRAWLYNGRSPGPVLRGRQGGVLTVEFENRLQEPTTVHWHGLRVPVEMDGTPVLSQPPIAPGDTFTYTLPLKDAGTFWYHPHVNSAEQVGRGLHGALVVEEPPEIAARLGADRELIWAIDDWRLTKDAQIAPFGGFHDMSHAGRMGNVLTVNGTYLTREELRAGERIRLRLVNVANAQTFRLRFAPLDPWLIALDGHPVAPQRLGDKGLWLSAGQRADIVFDVTLDAGETAKVIDDAYGSDNAYEIMTWRVANAPPRRTEALRPPQALPANPIPTPDLASAEAHSLVFEGGARGGLRGAMMDGAFVDMRTLARAGKLWATNGAVAKNLYTAPPWIRASLGTTHVVTLENRTRWRHPIHLHGHSFHVLRERDDPLSGAEIRDTVLLQPDQTVRIAFVADNPGRWMLHCHVLEHQASGMMGVLEVV